MDPIVEYMNSLYNFHTSFARCNTPLLSTVTGRLENSANCLVGSAGISCISQDAQLVFNEASKRNRVIPHGGASYYLTRMPGELGTFLALTGTPFTGSEAKEVLGLADEILNWNTDLQELISDRLRTIDKTISAAQLHATDGITDNVFSHKNEAIFRGANEKFQFNKEHELSYSHMGFKKSQIEGVLKQKAEANVDMQYKQLLRKDLEHKVLHDRTKLGSGTTGYYLNHYAHTTDFIKGWIPFEEADCTNSICRSHENEINR